MELIKKIFGDRNSKALKALEPRVEEINNLEQEIEPLSNNELKGKTGEFKQRLAEGKTLDDILPEAFAVVREAAKRTLGQRHFDVQLMGGMVMHEGKIAEMRTGEGKTLVATLPVYLNALTGNGVHVVTVNDYLSRRDAVWMGQVYAFLGLSVGVVNSNNESYIYDSQFVLEDSREDEERDETGYFKVMHEFLRPVQRPEVYRADVTYGTNNEFGFDYLRDNLAYSKEQLRQRKHAFVIIDEIDSILIDEARTPLIISAPAEESGELYTTFAHIAKTLRGGEDYTVDEKKRATELTDDGIEKAERALGVENIYTEKGIKYVHHLETAVRAQALFHRDKHYVVKDGEVVIVDEFTGRLMPGRRYSEGLHQAIEAKEGVEIQKESRTFASITFQNYFRMYEKLSGMTGTAKSSEEEFYKVYDLDVLQIPTNEPISRIDNDDFIFQTESGKLKAVSRKVRELQEKGQPVLLGTASIEKNELISEFLDIAGIDHEVLNAKNHEREGEIIARAGRRGAVTIATNMAGRGVDIKLGGKTAGKEEYEEIKKLGGLFVLGTERHEARRIDNQLRGRAGRQGDPGETQFFVSLEDDLMRVFASDNVKNMMGRFGIPEDEPIKNKLITRALESAQEKIEGFNFDARRNVLSFDDVLNHQRETIYGRRRRILLSDEDEIEEELEIITADDEGLIEIVEKKKEELGREAFLRTTRRLTLQTIDMLWVEHLEAMDYLRGSVNLRGYGQRDPLVEYKKEGLQMFQAMEESIDEQVAHYLENIGQEAFQRENIKLRAVHKDASRARQAGGEEPDEGTKAAIRATLRPRDKEGEKIGRNDIVEIVKEGERRKLKYKKAERLIESKGWKLQGRAQQ